MMTIGKWGLVLGMVAIAAVAPAKAQDINALV